MLKVDQTDRHIINVPIPFTEEQLTMLVKHFNGFEDPETIKAYVAHIIEKKHVVLEPSHELGDGAAMAEIFSYGFMVLMKKFFKIDVDPTILWWHPMSSQIPVKVPEIEIEYQDIELESDQYVIKEAIDGATGKIIHADDLKKNTDEDE
jgi:hypothetical protein